MTISRTGLILTCWAAALLLQGCGTTASKDLPPAERRPPLVVPPDLTIPKSETELGVPDAATPGPATYSGYAGTAPVGNIPLLPAQSGMRIERAGSQRWLVVTGEPDKVWVALRAFFQKNNLLLADESPRTGIMETEWSQNTLDRKTLGDGLPGTRDKYRVRLERAVMAATTEIYLTHYGVALTGSGKDALWQLRAPDPEMETEMLRRMMVFLGARERQAQDLLTADAGKTPAGGKPQAELIDSGRGTRVVRMSSDMDNAWRRLGLALDRVGFVVEDRDRTKGLYFVRATHAVKEASRVKKGFFSWFGGGKEDKAAERYQVSLKALATNGKEAATEVEVLDAAGQADTSAVGKRLVELLFEQLNKAG